MDPDTPAPPEASLIRTARKAAGLTAEAAARATGGAVSPVYWRDVERGYGYRRGKRVRARASDRVLAHMAHAVRVTPERLTEAGRGDAATVLAEILGTAPAAAAASEAEEVLARLLADHPGDEVLQAIGAAAGPQARKPAYELVGEVLRWLERQGDPGAAEAERARLAGRYPDDEVLQVINRQRGKKPWMVAVEMLDWLASQAPAEPRARRGRGAGRQARRTCA